MKTLSLKIILLAASLWLPFSVYAAKNILVFGDSLSAGYGIAVEESWPSLLQQELKHMHSGYGIVNASISGETALGGRQRIAGALQQHQPAIVVLELGVNDGCALQYRRYRGQSGQDYRGRPRCPRKVLLVGMRLPPNYGEPYVAQFGNMYPKLAKKYRIGLLPFLFEGMAPQQFQPDNLHPTREAQPQLMRNVLKE